MYALMIKDFFLLLTFVPVGLILFIVLVNDQGFHDTFVTPDAGYYRTLGLAIPLWGALYGLAVGAQDQIRGTVDYLYHRPLHAAQIFWGQVAVHLLAVVLCIVLPFAILRLFDSGAFPADTWGEGIARVAGMSLLLPCFAAGLLLSQLPLPLLVRGVLLAPLMLWVLGPDITETLGLEVQSDPGRLFALHFGLTGLLLFMAWLCFTVGQDKDRPLASRVAWPLALILVTVASSLHLWANYGTHEVLNEARSVYLATAKDGSIHPTGTRYDSQRQDIVRFRLDPETYAVLEEDDDLRHIRMHREPGAGFIQRGKQMHYSGYLDRKGLMRLETFAHQPEGFMAHFVQPSLDRGYRVALARPDGMFSPRATLAPKDRNKLDASIQVGDPQDGTLWTANFTDDEPAYEAIPLRLDPESTEAPERFLWWVDLRRHMVEEAQKLSPWWGTLEGEPSVVFFETDRGLRGYETRTQSVWAVDPGVTQSWRDQWEAGEDHELTIFEVDDNLLTPTQEVRNRQGDVVYTHTFAPRRKTEVGAAVAAWGLSLLRAPIANPIAFGNIWTMHPEGAGQEMPAIAWLAPRSAGATSIHWKGWSAGALWGWGLWALALSGTIMLLRRRGVRGTRLIVWGLATALFGFTAMALALIVESRRAHRPVRLLAPNEAPEPWIRAAG